MTRETIEVCRECEGTRIYARRPSVQTHPDSDAKNYRCEECGATFDDPVTRKAHPSRNGSERSSQLVADLLDADPEEVGP